jgi:two-component system, sensor histidine kinase and response regulator
MIFGRGLKSRFNTIRVRLFLLLAIVLVPALLVQMLIYRDRYETRRIEELRANMEIARSMCMAFEQFVEDLFHQELAMGLAIASGQLSRETIHTILSHNASEHPAILSFAWVDPQGRVVHSSFEGDEGLDLGSYQFFLEMHWGGSLHVSDLFLLPGSGKPAFTIGRSFRNEHGELNGVVVAVAEPDLLHTVLAFDRIGDGAVGLVDRTGRLVFRNPTLELSWEERDMSGLPLIQDALRGREYSVERDIGFAGIPSVYAFTPIDSIGWFVGASRPESVVMALVQAGLIRHAGMFLAVMLFSIPLAALLAHSISSPVRRLRTKALHGGQDGGFSEHVEGPSEVRDLASALERMTGELQAAVLTAEERASELDAALEALRVSEEKYRSIFENSSLGVYRATLEGRILDANPALATMLGFSSPQELIREVHNVGEQLYVRPEIRGEFIRRLDVEGEVSGQEVEFRRKGGGTVTSRLYMKGIRHGDGRVSHLEGFIEDYSEQKQAEEALHVSERKYRMLFENSLVGQFRTDAEIGRILEVNQRCAEIYGFSRPEEMIGRLAADFFVNQDERSEIRSQISLNKPIVNRISRVRRSDGSEIFVAATAWEGSEPGTVEGIHVDITEQVKAQDELRASEERLRRLVEHMPVMIHAHDEQGRYIYWNKECERVTGYPAEEVLANPGIRERFYPEESYRTWIGQVHEVHEDFRDLEIEMVCADGVTRAVSTTNISSKVDIPGWHLWETGIDITELKKVERVLRESERKFRTIFQSSPVPIAIVAWEDSRILDANTAFLHATGYAPSELIGRTTPEISFWSDSGQRDEVRRILAEKGAIRDFEAHLRVKSGEIRTLQLSVDLLEIGERVCMVVAGKDITARRRMEHSLRELNEQLEDKVRLRTLELERASRAKDEFLANMSHEIRTPLTGILGMTELSLLDRHEPGEIRSNLEAIRSAAKSLNRIINDLFDFSAIAAGRLRILPMEFALHEELVSLAAGYEEQARAKGLSWGLHIAANVPERVVTDQARLRQILINLLNNGLKFTAEGGVKLDVSCPDPDHLAFAVSDTGIGIPADRIRDLFESFTQLDATITKRYGGTGLGLAISKKLAELLGGAIDVQSTEGTGSVFTLIIPVEVPERDESAPTTGPAPSATRPLRILLVEDNPVNRAVIQMHLSRQGHSVRTAANGRQALEELGGSEFDLVLMDVQMPEMNGLDATKAIRAGEGGRNPVDIPIIALTAYAMKGDRERFLGAGMDGYVTKPVDFEELAGAIAEVAGKG